MRLRIGDRVRVIRGDIKGREGVVEDIGSRVISVRLDRGDWPFTTLAGFARSDLIVIEDDVADVGEALL